MKTLFRNKAVGVVMPATVPATVGTVGVSFQVRKDTSAVIRTEWTRVYVSLTQLQDTYIWYVPVPVREFYITRNLSIRISKTRGLLHFVFAFRKNTIPGTSWLDRLEAYTNPKDIVRIVHRLNNLDAWVHKRIEGLERAKAHVEAQQQASRARLDAMHGLAELATDLK